MQPDTGQMTVAYQLLCALDVCDYLTAQQAARLLGKERSVNYIRDKFRSLTGKKLAVCLAGPSITMPLVYTLTKKGRDYAGILRGTPPAKRFRPAEEQDKAHNPVFMQHTLAVSDVLIAAQLLAKTIPALTVTRLFTERALRRKIAVTLPAHTSATHHRQIYIEPDASCDFLIHKAWQTFIHIEIYRTLPPAEWRFKQKVMGYVTYAVSGLHEEVFGTPSLSIAVIAATKQMAATLKHWTEEALAGIGQVQYGELFYFRSLNTATARPENIYVAPLWEQAFSTTKTPLLVLE
jgi:hypothetical protein